MGPFVYPKGSRLLRADTIGSDQTGEI